MTTPTLHPYIGLRAKTSTGQEGVIVWVGQWSNGESLEGGPEFDGGAVLLLTDGTHESRPLYEVTLLDTPTFQTEGK